MFRSVLTTLLFAGLSIAAQGDSHQADASILPGAYIFEFESDHDTSLFYNEADGQSTTRVKFAYDLFKGVSIQFNDADTAEDIATKMAALPVVKNMWPVKTYGIPTPRIEWTAKPGMEPDLKRRALDNTTDTFSPHVMTQVDKLRAKGITGTGIKIAVVDSGIDYGHPALGGCFGPGCLVSIGTDFVGDAFNGSYTTVPPDPDDDPMDCGGHGTYVAGIIAAQDNKFGFTGAAPGVTLGAYKVFGCSGVTGTDILIAAFNQAYQDGADIITASIGDSSGWASEPWAVAVTRIVEKGVPCTISTGNSGDVGMFYAGGAADGHKVMSIASYDNTDSVSLLNISHYTVNGSSDKIAFGSTAGTPAAWGNVTLPLWAPSYDTTIANGGCDPYPSNTPDLSGYIVLVRRGTCRFVQKAQNAADAGAKYILLYNNVDGTAAIDVSTVEGILAAGMVNSAVGTKWIELLKQGSTVTLEMSDGSDGQVTLQETRNNVTGGSISTYSSWGPTFEMDVKPQFGTPGASILSTYPVKKGSFAVQSGTSMACPLAAAIVALIAEVRGTLDPSLIENLMSSTANPQLFNNGTKFFDYLAPVPQQGGGMVQAYDAAYSTLLLSTSSLSFNDTDHFVEALNFTIHNTGNEDIDLSISHIPTKSVYTLAKDSIYPATFPNEVADAHASLDFSESKLSIGAGERVAIEVLPTPPDDLDAERLALWSGYIAINGSDGSSLSLPYQGLTGSLHDSRVLGSNDTWISLSNDTDLNPVPTNNTFILPVKGQNATDWAPAPALAWNLALGSAKLQADLISVSAGNSIHKSIGAPSGFPALWISRGNGSVIFTGKLADGGYAPAGKYKVSYQALRIFGDENKKSDWDEAESPVFSISYPYES
ncbi:Minor extracellular protease vpr [Fusarium albosuccineum]|uniref:Minor extracellular protease vpr n=1 Tax=Fusarium albosuccineum TaxID=1237068 RepID=A0A8H4L6X9_9HYPO|nr:Minor extracellular protease vpr [Fusarium albosuccineum]